MAPISRTPLDQLSLQLIAFGGQGSDLVRHLLGIGLRLPRPVDHRQADDLPGDLAKPVQEPGSIRVGRVARLAGPPLQGGH